MKSSFNFEDIIQICVGAFALAVPISFSEEAWQLAQTLPFTNLLLLLSLSFLFLSLYTFESVFQRNIRTRRLLFVSRIIFAYVITFFIVALVLLSINKLPLLTEPLVALKRIVVISMPASMGAIIVDSFDKE
ncbi:MAG: DUF2391 family protein [Pseudoalteromonas spongiae]|uniref:DUF2391 family protein n=1 Tax=Pseudoalteromonas spongiae TaxID=298657 RepID=A0ABU8F061_9GAMM|nr:MULTISPECIES: DUF2391 family protein [Pseudoalteromonas]MCF6457479.1 DUF2391 family protein [Pseudoalteromonas sp. MMG024]TMO88772.1 DUF2391 domain-containing protein [Pseudoalteromonas spongiae]